MKIVEVDPDGLLEDRVEILRINYNFLMQQYCRSLKLFLVTVIALPPLGIFDFYNYF